jgi:hypothetical protein
MVLEIERRCSIQHLFIYFGEDENFPYPLGDFPPATLLDWALLEDEGNVDAIEDIPWKVKGRRELLNLECSINYDAKGASSRCGKGKAYAC